MRGIDAKQMDLISIKNDMLCSLDRGVRKEIPQFAREYPSLEGNTREAPHITEGHKRNMKLPNEKKENELQISFLALLYADNTILYEDEEKNMTAVLWAIEEVSSISGLKLNKKANANKHQKNIRYNISGWNEGPKDGPSRILGQFTT